MREPRPDPALLMLAMAACGWLVSPWATIGWLCVVNLRLWQKIRAGERRRALAVRVGGTLASRRQPRVV